MQFDIKKTFQDPEGGPAESRSCMASYGETRQAAVLYLMELKLFDKLEFFSAHGEEVWEIPTFNRLACYAVPGEIEGHDIFVEAIDRQGERHLILTGRTFWGYFMACEIAGELARFFYQDNS